MKKVLISACLIGDKVRYDGRDNTIEHIEQLMKHFELIPFCPEVEGGLSVPRLKSEIRNGRIFNEERKEVTKYFLSGANKALNICKYMNIELAILKEDSPSCGVKSVYDGTFSRRKIPGQGITAALLKRNGVEVISELDVPDLLEKLASKKDAAV